MSDARALRLFLLKLLLFAAVWGALFFRAEWLRYGYWLATWAAVVAVGLLFPAPFRPLRRALTRLGSWVGHGLAWLALAAIYWLGVAPLGILARLAGKSFMPKGKDAKASTYWERRAEMPKSKAEWEKQF